MKLSKRERLILEFLAEPAHEDLVVNEFAPMRAKSKTHWEAPEFHKVRQTLARMIARGLIRKQGSYYERR
jgi:hypothetical protein